MSADYTLKPVTLADHLAEETAGSRTPAQDPLAEAEELLEEARFQRVMRMTAVRFVKLSPAEKRNYRRWAAHFARVFAEKAALFERHAPADIDLPTFLQKQETA
jgi:histone H3/H4